MTIINTTDLTSNPKKYFDLAGAEQVLVRHGRKLVELVIKENKTLQKAVPLNPSPSNDPYFDNPENIKELNRRIALIESNQAEFITVDKNNIDEFFSWKK
ncbi:MAG: hypothetical protein LBU42_06585 [Prevotellaceae bacterium]|jgi:hypothetical protein|nr:hypothetical protein [Prevotellaceae bacterium]